MKSKFFGHLNVRRRDPSMVPSAESTTSRTLPAPQPTEHDTITVDRQTPTRSAHHEESLCADAHFASQETYEFLCESALENTLDLLLEDRNIVSLLRDPGSMNGIFCLRGPPRCGKSCAAALFIKHLRQNSPPNATIAYYFFNSARAMTSVRDAINSICHQLGSQDSESTIASTTLLAPRTSIRNSGRAPMGVKRFLDQTLGPYMQESSRKIIIIVDGIDEADFTIMDPVSRKSEMGVFLHYLAKKSHLLKVLLVGRPLARLRQYIPELVSMSFPLATASLCIESWVENFIAEHPYIEKIFHQAGFVAVAYFREHSKGNITWSQNVLNELFSLRGYPSRFRQRLESVPNDPTILEESHKRVLSNLDVDDLDLAEEIICRLATSTEGIGLAELKDHIEQSQGRTFTEAETGDQGWSSPPNDAFTKFVLDQCGSFLSITLVGSVFQYHVVTFNHPAFVKLSSDLPYRLDDFSLREQAEFYTSEVLSQLKELLSHPLNSKMIAPTQWIQLLPKAWTYGDKAAQVLICLYRLCCRPHHRPRLFLWVKEMMLSDRALTELSMSALLRLRKTPLDIAADNILAWITRCKVKSSDSAGVDPNELETAVRSCKELLRPCFLTDTFAKVAACAAFFGNSRGTELRLLFAFAFKQYSRNQSQPDVLQNIMQRYFQPMVQWLGIDQTPKSSALGYIYFLLQEWQLSALFYEQTIRDGYDSAYLRLELGKTYEGAGRHLDAVAQYKEAINLGYPFHHGCVMAAQSFSNADDPCGFSEFAVSMDIDNEPPSDHEYTTMFPMSVYLAGGDYHKAIRAFNHPDEIEILLETLDAINYNDQSDENLNYIIEQLNDMLNYWHDYEPRILSILYRAYLGKGNQAEALCAVRRALSIRCASALKTEFRIAFADIQNELGSTEDGIKVLRENLNGSPHDVHLWKKVFELLSQPNRFDQLQEYWNLLLRSPKRASTWLSSFRLGCSAMAIAYEQQGNWRKAIEIYERGIETNPGFHKFWSTLCKWYGLKQNQALAVTTLKVLLQRIEEDERDVGASRKHFLRRFLEDEIDYTVEWFVVWYGIRCLWDIIDQTQLASTPGPSGWNPLHVVASEGYEDMVDVIVPDSAYIVGKETSGCTPLHLASKNGHLNVVRSLLRLGADHRAKDNLLGFTALAYAIEQEEWDIVRELRKIDNEIQG